jgi:hypothetical protein
MSYQGSNDRPIAIAWLEAQKSRVSPENKATAVVGNQQDCEYASLHFGRNHRIVTHDSSLLTALALYERSSQVSSGQLPRID